MTRRGKDILLALHFTFRLIWHKVNGPMKREDVYACVQHEHMENYTLRVSPPCAKCCTWGPHAHPDTCTKRGVQVVHLRRSTPLYVCCAGRRRTVNLTEGEWPPALQLCLSAVLTAVFNSTKIILAASCHLAPLE